MRSAFVVLLGATCAFSQSVGAGLKAGIPFTDFLDNAEFGLNAFKHPKQYIIGVTGELRLPFGLAIEGDALYRKVYSSQRSPGSLLSDVLPELETTGNTWEFPVLVKYRMGKHRVRPFVDGGFAWNRLSGLTETVRNLATGQAYSQASNTTLKGLVLGGGVDIKLLLLHLEPEVRFTRWGAKRFDGGNNFRHNQNQAEFLLGISF